MGGFMVNGCGVADSFYPKKALGNHYCSCCRSIQEFDLMEIKRKIRVVFVPTLSINTKYGVACKKCKTGIYIEDAVRDSLLYDKLSIETQDGKIVFINPAESSGNVTVP